VARLFPRKGMAELRKLLEFPSAFENGENRSAIEALLYFRYFRNPAVPVEDEIR
jgi:hypothetical protein